MDECNVYIVASLSTRKVLIVVSNVFVYFKLIVYFNRASQTWLIMSLAVSGILQLILTEEGYFSERAEE